MRISYWISDVCPSARPITEARTNSATAPRNDARGPKRPTSQAFSSIDTVIADRKPLDIQCAWSWPIPKAPMMSGIATFTIVDDMIIEIMAIIVVKVTASLLIAGGAAGAAAGRLSATDILASERPEPPVRGEKGRASCGVRVCEDGTILGGAGSLKKKK